MQFGVNKHKSMDFTKSGNGEYGIWNIVNGEWQTSLISRWKKK